MSARRVKEKLKAGGVAYGMFIQYLTNPAAAEVFPAQGLDFVIFTVEHNALDLADFTGLSQALRGLGIACLARCHSRAPDDIARICDAPFDGVVIPYVEDVAETRRAVAAATCRPLKGEALERVLAGGGFPSEKTRRYIEEKNADLMVCPMIESVRSVENLDAICSIPGIDAVFVGPNDLTVSMGIPEERDNPEFVAMIQRIIDVAAKHGIAAGAHFSHLPHAKRLIAQGGRFIPFSSDLRLIQYGIPGFLAELGAAQRATAEKVI